MATTNYPPSLTKVPKPQPTFFLHPILTTSLSLLVTCKYFPCNGLRSPHHFLASTLIFKELPKERLRNLTELCLGTAAVVLGWRDTDEVGRN